MASIEQQNPPGCMLGWHEDGDDIFGDPGPSLGQREERLQKKFACYRLCRNEWFRNLANFIKSEPYAKRWVIGFNYFHSIHTDTKGITNDWRILGNGNEPVGSEGAQGWIQGFSDDPSFLDTPFSLKA